MSIKTTKIFCSDEQFPVFTRFYNEKTYLNDKTLQTECITNGIVMPLCRSCNNFHKYECGVLRENGEYIPESGKNLEPFNDFKLPSDIPYDDRKVIYCGHLSGHYGHFLLEATVRLWYYLKEQNPDCYLCFSSDAETLPSFAKEFFELLNIREEQLVITKTFIKFREILIPESSFVWWKYYTKEFLIPFHKAAEQVPEGSNKRIYLSRRSVSVTARTFGEDILEQVMNENGFKSVEFQFMTLREQISTIKGAEVIAGINGTALHNVLFSERKPDVIILNRSESVDSQCIINQAANTSSYLIQVYANPLKVVHGIGPFIVEPTDYFKKFCSEYSINIPEVSASKQTRLLHFLGNYVRKYRKDSAFSTLAAENLIDREQLAFLNNFKNKHCTLLDIICGYLSFIFTFNRNRAEKHMNFTSCVAIYKYTKKINSLFHRYYPNSRSSE